MTRRQYDHFKNLKFPKLTKKDIPKQIGILRPFYEDLYLKSKMLYDKQLKKYQVQLQNGEKVEEPMQEIANDDELILIEDDDLPLKQRNNRPKIPPNGKITQVKKKFIPTAFFLEKQDELKNRLEAIVQKSGELTSASEEFHETSDKTKEKDAPLDKTLDQLDTIEQGKELNLKSARSDIPLKEIKVVEEKET